MKKKYRIVGVMSGTSLDGISLALCTFSIKTKKYTYKIEKVDTIPYTKQEQQALKNAIHTTAYNLVLLDIKIGEKIAQAIYDFLKKEKKKIDFIASHGHTVFHQPEKKITSQIGNGAVIATTCNIPVVCDFRKNDMALNGQAAPLVPIGEKMLFQKYSCFLNLGGIANISFHTNKKTKAFDVCACNMVLNQLINRIGKPFDNEGKLASKGEIHKKLFDSLEKITYYKKEKPKSMGIEWVEENILPLMETDMKLEDILRTYVEHIASQIGKNVKKYIPKNEKYIYCSGGGVLHTLLLKRIEKKIYPLSIKIPSQKRILYKESVIFAFMGLLRWLELPNTIPMVTGARRSTVSGSIYLP